ncbi:MAG: hypothetical protein NZM09_01410 [Ignavibacterium sp.]|nr:hypothetical protein [Ignavibacterium sp.]MDW8374330.1 hypothetical protein [Ignavibacteriales bacterium]
MFSLLIFISLFISSNTSFNGYFNITKSKLDNHPNEFISVRTFEFPSSQDTSKIKKKFFEFHRELNDQLSILDSLIKREYRIEKFFDKDFFEKFPNYNSKEFEEFIDRFLNKFDKDSLFKRLDIFRKRNLINNSDLIEL